jgi:hypothetical protein
MPRDLSCFGKVDSADSHRRLLRGRREQGTCHSIRHVVVAASSVVDAVLATARRVAFEANQLADQTLAAEQLDFAAVQHGQEVEVERALRVLARLVLDAVLLKVLDRELAYRSPITLVMR